MPDPVNPAAPAVTDPAAVAASAPPGGPPNAPAAVAPTEPQRDLLAPATPAQPATPAATNADDNTITYEPTGDVGLDLALEFFGKMGLALDSAEMQEAGKGNFQYLEAKLASMGDKAKGYESYLALGKDAQARIEAKSKADFEALEKTVHDAVGGKETWAAVQQFARTAYKPDELKEVSGVLNAGGIGATAMAHYLHQQALAANGTTVPGKSAVDTSSTPAAPLANLSPLTREAWRAEYQKGIAKHGIVGFSKTPEYAALQQRFPR